MRAHRLLRWGSLVVLTAVLGLLLMGQSYREDISDFLPLDGEQQEAFQTYQNTVGARRIYVVGDAEVLDKVEEALTLDCRRADDPEVMQETMTAIYARMPYLLTPEDYARIDSLTVAPDFISQQLENDKQMLMLPSAGMMAIQIQHDPLNLFTPVLERLRGQRVESQSVLLIDSPYGASETKQNGRLVDRLQQVCDSVGREYANATVRITGGPVIAVGNAQQIKTDSIRAIAIAAVLICLLLWLALRDMRNMLLIVVSIGWGWLFAMGCLTLVHQDVSIIVIGISSVILGIAVNYPLHLIVHLAHTADVRSALKEITLPLVVGNVTTVGAFLALVPLRSVALRDLGLFSAFLLVGTIVFVLLWLPHLVHSPQFSLRERDVAIKIHSSLFESVALQSNNCHSSLIVWTVVVLTLVLGWFGLQTSFDTDLRHINYMTDEQRQDMQLLEQVSDPVGQESDPRLWNEWRSGKGTLLCQQLRDTAGQVGFANDAFDDFYQLMDYRAEKKGESITTVIISNLTDNFNYIGWACGCIVFFFLWFSLGSIELALLSFLPMAVSWVWILGIMSLLGIQFNVVNIILATFIFGQGDDYTIFMTEGCQYEYAYRRPMLSSYKRSIIISALMMFIGIGALIVAKHPALFSLAEVTIIGMFSVVLMAWLLPPLIFRWLVYDKGRERVRPLTLMRLVCGGGEQTGDFVADCYRYRGVEISSAVNKRLRRYRKKGYDRLIDQSIAPSAQSVVMVNSGWGETALLYALQRPQRTVIAVESNHDKCQVAKYVAERRAPNLTIMEYNEFLKEISIREDFQTILLDPSQEDIERYAHLKPFSL